MWKIRTCLFCIKNSMPADDLPIHGDKASGSQVIIPLTNEVGGGGTGFTLSVRPSFHPSVHLSVLCPLCIFHNTSQIHLIKQLQKVCCVLSCIWKLQNLNWMFQLSDLAHHVLVSSWYLDRWGFLLMQGIWFDNTGNHGVAERILRTQAF